MSESLHDIPSQLKNIERDYIKIARIHYLVIALIICVPLAFVAYKENDGFLFSYIFLAALALFAFCFFYFPKKEYTHTRYGLINDVFYVQEGIWFKKRIAVAQNRIQHTDVTQGPIARRYDLATLTMHTAGMREADIKVPGLKHADAIAMRDHLIHLNKQLQKSSSSANKNMFSASLTLDENSMATSVLALRPDPLREEE